MASGEIQKRFEGDFVINTVKLASDNHETDPVRSDIVGDSVQVPISLSIPGPITLKKVLSSDNIPYIASNGGDPLDIPRHTS